MPLEENYNAHFCANNSYYSNITVINYAVKAS
jgi:hypothetical protein